MNNAIKYFYNLEPNEVRQCKDSVFLISNNCEFILKDTELSDEEINLKSQLPLYYNFFHKIVKNNSGSYITYYNKKKYILIRLSENEKRIDFENILKYNNIYINDNSNPISKIRELWIAKNDYIYNQLSQNTKKNPYLMQIYWYCDGVTETAIQLIKTIENYKIQNYLVHKRVKYTSTTNDFFNPLNIVVDSKIRDVAEYIKDSFFRNINLIESCKKYIESITNVEAVYFLARLIYPSYFFDLYEKEELNDKEIFIISNKINDYENFIFNIYMYIREKKGISSIEWLEQKKM